MGFDLQRFRLWGLFEANGDIGSCRDIKPHSSFKQILEAGNQSIFIIISELVKRLK